MAATFLRAGILHVPKDACPGTGQLPDDSSLEYFLV